MRFCLELSHRSWLSGDAAERIERTIAQSRAADAAGFASIWLTEDPEGWDAFAVLAMLARETTRIQLGPGVTNPFIRHPNLIAASLATLDRISAGRAFLGLGRGQPEWYEKALGAPAVNSLAAVEETVDLLGQWRQPPHVASSNGPIPIDNWQRSTLPLGNPPVYLAATSPKMQALAGRIADGVRFNALASTDFLKESINRVRAAAIEAGRDPAGLRFFFDPGIRISDDSRPSLEGLKTMIAMVHALPGMDRQLIGAAYEVEPVMARVRTLMKTDEILKHGGNFNEIRLRGDLAAAKLAIPDDLVLAVAVVGSISDVRRRLGELAGLGITDVFFNLSQTPGGIEALPELAARLKLP